MLKSIYAIAAALLASSASADGHSARGDAAAGEVQFNRQCVACHVVATDGGEVLAGRNARTGPNLFGVPGRQIGSHPEFRYSDALVELGQSNGGTVWTEDAFVGFVQDSTGWLRGALDDSRARSKMAYRVRSEDDAINIYAYLASIAAN